MLEFVKYIKQLACSLKQPKSAATWVETEKPSYMDGDQKAQLHGRKTSKPFRTNFSKDVSYFLSKLSAHVGGLSAQCY